VKTPNSAPVRVYGGDHSVSDVLSVISSRKCKKT